MGEIPLRFLTFSGHHADNNLNIGTVQVADHHITVFIDLRIVHRTRKVSGGFMSGTCNGRLLVFL
jgi:hypothetical protein